MRDPYEVIGVAKGADIKEVKKAYRKLARSHHPDLHPGDKASEDRFKEIAAAYDFLSDAEKKAAFDRGEIDASGAPRAERRFYRDFAESGSGTRYGDPKEYFADIGEGDIFAELFRARRDARTKIRGADVTHAIEIDFLDAVNGSQRELAMSDGRRVKVTIPPGTADGQTLRLKGLGGPSPTRGPAGDLLLEIKVRPHPAFTLKDNDIWADLPVTLGEAVLGARIEVPTVDGPVSMTVPKGSNSGIRLRVRGKGAPLPGGGGRGDHYVTLQVRLPEPPDPDLIRFAEDWSPKHPYRVR